MYQTNNKMASALAFVMCLSSTNLFAQDNEAVTDASPVVTTTKAALDEIETRISVSGTLVAAEEVLVNTRINGYAIESIKVEIGDFVEAGTVLATLDSSASEAQLAQAEAELARSKAAIGQANSQIDASTATLTEAEATLKRNERLRKSGNISESTIEQTIAAASSARANVASARDGLNVANAQYTAAQSQRDLAKLTLARTEITAPVAGLISARNAKLGEIASGGGEPMFRMIRNGELEVEVEVVETALPGLDKGDEANIVVAGVGPVKSEVRLVAPTVSSLTRLGLVRLSLQDNPQLKAGLSATGWITVNRHQSVTIPASAVLTEGLKSYVQIVVDGIVQTRTVTAGVLSADGRREIVQGLEGGESIIARAGAFFIDGDVVRAVESQASESATPEAKP